MNFSYVIAIACVVGLSAGQILFKYSANSFAENGLSFRGLTYLFAALTIYMIQTFAWIWALKHIGLGKIYPIMAFAFVLIPLGSIYFFKESFTSAYWIGASLIVAGVIIATNSSHV